MVKAGEQYETTVPISRKPSGYREHREILRALQKDELRIWNS